MRTALLHPERVATLTLVDTHEGFAAFTRRAAPGVRRQPACAAARRQGAERHRRPGRALAHRPPRHARAPGRAEAQHRVAAQGVVHQVARGDGRTGRSRRHLARSRRRRTSSSVPTIRSRRRRCITKWRPSWAARPVSVLPRAGHLSNIENPDAFNEAALRWLTRQRGLGAAPTKQRFTPAWSRGRGTA